MPGEKILVVVSTAEKGKALLALNWAARLREKELAPDVKVYLFGPVEELVARGDREILDALERLYGLGVEVLACHGVAERGGFEEELKKVMGEERVTHVGRMIVERIREGYTPLVF